MSAITASPTGRADDTEDIKGDEGGAIITRAAGSSAAMAEGENITTARKETTAWVNQSPREKGKPMQRLLLRAAAAVP